MTEFNQVLQNDSCRLQQLQCHTSAPGHPFNQFFWGKFCTNKLSFYYTFVCFLNQFIYYVNQLLFFLCMEGNKKSLVDAMEKGINLREQILQLYNDYYHGELMKLVVIGGG